MSAEVDACGLCKKPLRETSPIAALFLWVPGRRKPFLLCSDEEFIVCAHPGCSSVLKFIKRAIDGHPITRVAAMGWNLAKVTFYDPAAADWRVEPEHPVEVARA